MIPGGCIGTDLEVVDGGTDGGQHRERVCFGIVNVAAIRGVTPMAWAVIAMPHTGRDRVLARRCVVAKGRADLEETGVGIAAIRVPFRRGQQVRQDRRAHNVEIRTDRIGETHIVRHAAIEIDIGTRHEGPSDRLHHPALCERAFRERGAALRDIDRWGRQRCCSLQRHDGNFVEAFDP